MTNCIEEQNNEIEALESIYPSEFEILETEPYYKFKIFVKSDEYDEEDQTNGAAIDLIFQYTESYPDEPPIVEIAPLCNLENDDVEELKAELSEQFAENLGMVMVFTLVSFSMEWLNNKIENNKLKEEEEKERKVRELEEAERKRLEGTRVTVESFLAWKTRFDNERLLSSDKDRDEKGKRLTGRELFMTDNTLNESDLTFIGKEEDEVAVDESLFQDLDDLELEDDLELSDN